VCEDRAVNEGFRCSPLPALCPARLPARRPSVTTERMIGGPGAGSGLPGGVRPGRRAAHRAWASARRGRADAPRASARERRRRRTGSAPTEQVGRRWPGRRHLGREAEVGENLPDHDGVLDGGHHTHVTATPRTGQHVYGEGVAQQVWPRPPARGGRRRWVAHGGGRFSPRRRAARPQRARTSLDRHDGIALQRAARLRHDARPQLARRGD
jgi:hypothetical protein